MKKRVVLLLLSFVLIAGCAPKTKPISLEDSYYGTREFEDVPAKEIKKLEKNKENFAVFVYMASCTSCANFDRVLENFTKEYPMKFYKISLLNIEGTKMEDTIKYSPSVVVYKDGEVYAYLNAISDDDMKYYKNADNFKEWFSKYVILEDK